jgi:hypothetical protein
MESIYRFWLLARYIVSGIEWFARYIVRESNTGV